jgi:hypothetical protein
MSDDECDSFFGWIFLVKFIPKQSIDRMVVTCTFSSSTRENNTVLFCVCARNGDFVSLHTNKNEV